MRKNPTNYLLLHNKSNDALVLIKENHSDLFDYLASGFERMEEGSENDCLRGADNFWDENNIPEDVRIFSKVK